MTYWDKFLNLSKDIFYKFRNPKLSNDIYHIAMNNKKDPHFTLIIVILFSILFNQESEASDISTISDDFLIQEGEKNFKNIRQLTFSGEIAEAYLSGDGKKIFYKN